jgi:signal transduction histidine kinase
MLDVARLSSGRMQLDIETVDLTAILQEVGDSFLEELTNTGATLTIESPEPVIGQSDRLRIEQIVTNLLSNAAKYGKGTPVFASVRRRGDSAVFVVRDGGIGIPTENQARIFERFERGDHGPGHTGFGLGLWIVREIAIALGGTIQVESALGKGATFTVVLPLDRPSNAAATNWLSGAPPP